MRFQEAVIAEQPEVIGCIVCDLTGELRARDSLPGEKPPKNFYSEHERDVAIERLISGEAYKEHEELKEELLAGRTVGTDVVQLHSKHTEGSYYDDQYDYEGYLD